MPNWVQNEVTINGPAATLSNIKELLARPYSMYWPSQNPTEFDLGILKEQQIQKVFSFWNIVSPEDMEHYYLGDNWYGWNCANWGTKWDADEDQLVHETRDELFYTFSTAWSEPDAALRALSQLFPDIEIRNRWTEEQGFGEEVIYSASTRDVIESWDIPEYTEEEEDEI